VTDGSAAGARGSTDAPRAGTSNAAARLLSLQRTAGNAAAVRLLARERSSGRGGVSSSRDRRLQRLIEGEDPLTELANPTARGLIYGMSPARKTTSQRLTMQDATLGYDVFRTVDAYNLAAGINDAFGSGGKTGVTAIFKVREALSETNPVSKWRTHFPTAEDPKTNPDLRAWIEFLTSEARYVGLYDFGAAATGTARVKAKHRFTKNLKSLAHATTTAVTPAVISDWLRPGRTYDEALDDADDFGNQDLEDLSKWLFSAFFRRTSKLGILFTVLRGHTIHMNIAADPTYDPSNPKLPDMRIRGLEEIEAMDPEQRYGRAITLSEFRFAHKLNEELNQPKNLGSGAGRINFFGEIKDPPVTVLVPVAGGHHHKKRWYKPWTWFK
jgi:hypothetical protein